jgi:hypothetical protein
MFACLVLFSVGEVYHLNTWGMWTQTLDRGDSLLIDSIRSPTFIRVIPHFLPGTLQIKFTHATNSTRSLTHFAKAGERLYFQEGHLEITYSAAVAPCRLAIWLPTYVCGLAAIHSPNPHSVSIGHSAATTGTLCYLLEFASTYSLQFILGENASTTVMSMDGEHFQRVPVSEGISNSTFGRQFVIAYGTGTFSAWIETDHRKTDWSDEDGLFMDCSDGVCAKPTLTPDVFAMKTDRSLDMTAVNLAIVLAVVMFVALFVLLFWRTDLGLSLASAMRPLDPVVSLPFT